MKHVLILVEGETEEAVVNAVLQPHLVARGIWPTPKILTTKRTKSGPDFKGGVRSYEQVRREIGRLLEDTSAAVVTTMIDFYGFPPGFSGWNDVPPANRGARARVEHIESRWREDVNHPRFDPHLVLHETEALIFSDPLVCDTVFPQLRRRQELERIRRSFASPEDIDEGPATAPSKRILQVMPDYKKVAMGPRAIETIGLSRIRPQCPHFDAWLARLEALAD